MTAQFSPGETGLDSSDGCKRGQDRYEVVTYEGEEGVRAVLQDSRNPQAWLDSSVTVAVTQ